MIEKKISYSINIEKPSKTKPVKQGGVLNYLGKQKTVNAPVKWRSSKDHPIAHLSYITKDEEKILIDLNLYGSLKGKPNKGPFGLPSLQGSGGGAGGDGGSGDGGSGGGDSSGDSGPGDSGPGGSDDGSSSGVGSGDSGDAGTSSAASAADAGYGGPGGEFGGADSGGPSGPGGSEGFSTDVGPGPGEAEGMGSTGFGQQDTFASDVDESISTQTGIMSTLSEVANKAFAEAKSFATNPATIGRAIGTVVAGPIGGFVGSQIGSQIGRGVTGPDDYSQATTSVQSGPAPSPSEGGGTTAGGITTIPLYAPLYNQTTGDPLLDSLIARYRANLPYSSFGV